MTQDIKPFDPLSKFAKFLANHDREGSLSLPPLSQLSETLNLSVASLREQLEVARALGLVDVRPRKGIQKLPYRFSPAVRLSLAYALENDISHFEEFADLRKHIEEAYWYEAVAKLTDDDLAYLTSLIDRATNKLNGDPIQIPHAEHRDLHLTIYKRLNNEFVYGLLDVYWDAYESIGLNVYTGLTYLQEVWQFHRLIVGAICTKDFDLGYRLLLDHTDLLYHRPKDLVNT
ncbi:MAG: FCD domain-containing protein [Chloroflexota bacterium]